MKKILIVINIIGIISIASLIILFSTDNVRFVDPEYSYEINHDEFVKFSIKNSIESKIEYKIIAFNDLNLDFLSGKTFKLTGEIVYESVIGTKIRRDFVCIATGFTFETNPSDSYTIDYYYEK
jgi:hypothetical protein